MFDRTRHDCEETTFQALVRNEFAQTKKVSFSSLPPYQRIKALIQGHRRSYYIEAAIVFVHTPRYVFMDWATSIYCAGRHLRFAGRS